MKLLLDLNKSADTIIIDTNIRNKVGQSALWIASNGCSKGHRKCVELLLSECTVDVNLGDHMNNTPLLVACASRGPEQTAIVKLLLAVDGIDPNVNNRQLHAPLLLASHQGNVEVVSKLLTLDGIEINHIDEDGDSGNAIIIIISITIIINTVITYPYSY